MCSTKNRILKQYNVSFLIAKQKTNKIYIGSKSRSNDILMILNCTQITNKTLKYCYMIMIYPVIKTYKQKEDT